MPCTNRIDLKIHRSTAIIRTPRVMQIEGMFSIPPSQRSDVAWDVALPINEKTWNIGLIVGPSGCGKSTVAREAFGDRIISSFAWSKDRSIVDDFPKDLSIKDIAALLSSVGFSSPPSWLRPFHVLSNGEQFRVTMARAMAEHESLFVIDEFTSVVDRTVAQIGSHAIARTIRGRGKQFIAVACHYDIIDWLQPDWLYEPATKTFQWRELQQRPSIKLTIKRVDTSAWQIFKKHHYLDTSINKSAKCFIACVEDQPVAFASVLSFPHPVSPGWREHRTVCLPDYQGCGIGNVLSEFIGGLFRATGKPYRSTTGHPGMIRYRAKSKTWKMTTQPQRSSAGCKSSHRALQKTYATNRLVAGFEYVGPIFNDDARAFGVI